MLLSDPNWPHLMAWIQDSCNSFNRMQFRTTGSISGISLRIKCADGVDLPITIDGIDVPAPNFTIPRQIQHSLSQFSVQLPRAPFCSWNDCAGAIQTLPWQALTAICNSHKLHQVPRAQDLENFAGMNTVKALPLQLRHVFHLYQYHLNSWCAWYCSQN